MSKASSKTEPIDISGILEIISTRHRAPWILRTPELREFTEELKKIDPVFRGMRNVTNADIQILEEIALLCSYPPFVEDIVQLRREISQELGIRLPLKSKRKAEEVLKKIYFEARTTYWTGIQDLIRGYGLAYSLYWPRNEKFEKVTGRRNHFAEDKETHDRLNKTEAGVLYNDTIGARPSLIDCILLRNTPTPEDVFLCWNTDDNLRSHPNAPRPNLPGSHVGFSFNRKSDVPYIEVRFPAYSSLSEMRAILDGYYKQIQKVRASLFAVPNRKDRRKVKISLMLRAFYLRQQGKNLDSIANELDEVEGATGVGKADFRKISSVKRLLERVEKEMETRFGKNK